MKPKKNKDRRLANRLAQQRWSARKREAGEGKAHFTPTAAQRLWMARRKEKHGTTGQALISQAVDELMVRMKEEENEKCTKEETPPSLLPVTDATSVLRSGSNNSSQSNSSSNALAEKSKKIIATADILKLRKIRHRLTNEVGRLNKLLEPDNPLRRKEGGRGKDTVKRGAQLIQKPGLSKKQVSQIVARRCENKLPSGGTEAWKSPAHLNPSVKSASKS